MKSIRSVGKCIACTFDFGPDDNFLKRSICKNLLCLSLWGYSSAGQSGWPAQASLGGGQWPVRVANLGSQCKCPIRVAFNSSEIALLHSQCGFLRTFSVITYYELPVFEVGRFLPRS